MKIKIFLAFIFSCILLGALSEPVFAETSLSRQFQRNGYEVKFIFDNQSLQDGAAESYLTDVSGVILKDGEEIFNQTIIEGAPSSSGSQKNYNAKELSNIYKAPDGIIAGASISYGSETIEFIAVYDHSEKTVAFFGRTSVEPQDKFVDGQRANISYGPFLEIIQVGLRHPEYFERFDTIDEKFLKDIFSLSPKGVEGKYNIDLSESQPWDYRTRPNMRYYQYAMNPLRFSIVTLTKDAAEFQLIISGEHQIEKLNGAQVGMTFNQVLRRLPYKTPEGIWLFSRSDERDYDKDYDIYWLEYMIGRYTYRFVAYSLDGPVAYIIVTDAGEKPVISVNTGDGKGMYDIYYAEKKNSLQIINGNDSFNFNLGSYGIKTGFREDMGDYYIELVQDEKGALYLHTYGSNLRNSGRYADYKEAWSISEYYFLLDPLNYTPSVYAINYYMVTNHAGRGWIEWIFINDVRADEDELAALRQKYTQVKNTKYDIPY